MPPELVQSDAVAPNIVEELVSDVPSLKSLQSAKRLFEDDTGVKLIRAEVGIKAIISRWGAKKFLRR